MPLRSMTAGLLTLCALAASLLAEEDARQNTPADRGTPADWVSLPTDSQTKSAVQLADPAEFPSDVALAPASIEHRGRMGAADGRGRDRQL